VHTDANIPYHYTSSLAYGIISRTHIDASSLNHLRIILLLQSPFRFWIFVYSMSKERDLAELPTTIAEGQQIRNSLDGNIDTAIATKQAAGHCPRSLKERQLILYRRSGDRVLYTATAGEAAPQTVVRAGKRVGYAPPVASGTASYAKIPIPINHLVRGSTVVT